MTYANTTPRYPLLRSNLIPRAIVGAPSQVGQLMSLYTSSVSRLRIRQLVRARIVGRSLGDLDSANVGRQESHELVVH